MKSKISYATICMILFSIILSCSGGSSSSNIKITPARSYDFGDVAYSSSATKDFIFSNDTSVSINITSISITGTNANQFSVTVGGSATNVPAKSSHSITVKYAPIGGTAFAVLRVNYNDENGSPKEITVELHGKSIDSPSFQIDVVGTPPTYDFGVIASGNSVTHPFTITNSGNANLIISDVKTSVNNYVIVAGFTPGQNEVVTAGSQHQIFVKFAPTAVGTVNATLTIEHNAKNETSPFEVKLIGAGGSKTFETDVPGTPPTLDFGKVFSGVCKIQKVIEIKNNGFDDLSITNITLSSSSFSIVSGWTGSTIKVSPVPSKHEIVIEFDPQSATTYNETITFTHDGANVVSPTSINLTGIGTTNYNPEEFTLGYTPLSSTNYVILNDNEYKQIPIGFSFNFYGNSYSNLYVSSNGFIGFGPTTNYDLYPTSSPFPNSSAPNNMICLFATDMDPVLGAIIKYDVQGSAPNRLFIIHYSGIEDVNTTGIVSGQIKLYENTNVIELCYPTSGITWPTSSAYQIMIGIENQSGTLGVDYNGTDSNPVTATPSKNIRYR